LPELRPLGPGRARRGIQPLGRRLPDRAVSGGSGVPVRRDVTELVEGRLEPAEMLEGVGQAALELDRAHDRPLDADLLGSHLAPGVRWRPENEVGLAVVPHRADVVGYTVLVDVDLGRGAVPV